MIPSITRPLLYLILAFAVACGALFMQLPMSKLAQQTGVSEFETPDAAHAEAGRSNAEVGAEPETVTLSAATEIEEPDQSEVGRVTVEGRVSDNFGASIADLDIELQSKGFDGEEVGTTQLSSDRYGNFALQLVPTRQYRLEIRAAGDYAGYSLDAFTASSAQKLQDIVLERVEPVDVEGMIVDTDLAPVGDFELVLRHLTLEIPERIIRSDSSGYFSLRGIPAGEWRVATSQSNYFRIKGLELRPGEYRNLTLMIDRGSYHLSGWVRDRNGMPLERVIITLKSAFARDEYHSFSYRSIATDSNGAFEFAKLGGHRMTLGIYANGYQTYIRQHEFASFSDTLEIELLGEESP